MPVLSVCPDAVHNEGNNITCGVWCKAVETVPIAYNHYCDSASECGHNKHQIESLGKLQYNF